MIKRIQKPPQFYPVIVTHNGVVHEARYTDEKGLLTVYSPKGTQQVGLQSIPREILAEQLLEGILRGETLENGK